MKWLFSWLRMAFLPVRTKNEKLEELVASLDDVYAQKRAAEYGLSLALIQLTEGKGE